MDKGSLLNQVPLLGWEHRRTWPTADAGRFYMAKLSLFAFHGALLPEGLWEGCEGCRAGCPYSLLGWDNPSKSSYWYSEHQDTQVQGRAKSLLRQKLQGLLNSRQQSWASTAAGQRTSRRVHNTTTQEILLLCFVLG